MNKIPTLFERDWDGDRSRVLDKVTPGCEWVLAGEGVATQKYDGSCCLFRDGRLYKRHEVRPGKATPDGFELADEDDKTGKLIGWVPVGDGPEDRWHREALDFTRPQAEGTYELCGPKVQGNPEHLGEHQLIEHRWARRFEVPLSYGGLAGWLSTVDVEGIVFHHPDGRMAKIKAKDYGIKRQVSA